MATEHTRLDCIVDRLILAQDNGVRQANTLAHQGFHQQAAECRAMARFAETILNWISNGVPLDKRAAAAIAKARGA